MKRVALFAKPPVAGRVKTRLSPALPAREACELYAALLADTIEQVEATDADERAIWWADAAPIDVDVSLPRRWSEATQSGANLGYRMRGAFGVLLRGGARAVIVGADCPALSAHHIDSAFAALDTCDLVFGPATDGGYYLIGMTRLHVQLFEDIPWSTDSVLDESLGRAEAAGLKAHTLAPLDDLDTPADLVRWIARMVEDDSGADTHARAVLHQLGLAPRA